MHQLHLTIRGRVQGVGFRYFVLNRARELGINGTVRNRFENGVEVEAEGTQEPLRLLIAAVRRGPPGAEVTDVHEAWSEGPMRFQGFRIIG